MSTFYRKYRPTRFADVIGQDQAVTVLTQSLLRDKVAHAYLLTGPRGTGKTTLARLFARALNCSQRKDAEPCGKCPHCLAMDEHRAIDIIEIDAASHTGVDNIRELRDTITTTPVLGSHKVYIIDEAHMLSIGAWNALLKTLEEPPAHVVFLLATTNIAKVPETILSRSLRLDLRRFPIEHILTKLKKVAKAEKIDIDEASLIAIAKSASGGMRDAEVLFTQIATLEESPIRIDRTTLLLGATSTETLAALLRSIAEHNLGQGLTLIRTLGERGIQMTSFTHELLQYLRQALYAAVDPGQGNPLGQDLTARERQELGELAKLLGSERIIECLERFQEAEALIKYSPLPELPLEIALVKLIGHAGSGAGPKESGSGSQSTPESNTSTKPSPAAKTTPSPQSTPLKTTKTAEGHRDASLATVDFAKVRREWRTIVETAKRLNASLGVALSTTELSIADEQTAVLGVKYPFHKERLEKPENRLTIDTAFATILGFQVPWVIQVAEKIETEPASPILSQALETLGGKLVADNN